LDAIPIFDPLAAKAVRALEDACQWCDFLPGEKVVERGQQETDVYFMVSGNAHVLNFSDTGRVVDFATLKSGDFFGELAAIDGQPRSATVVAMAPCRIAMMPAQTFMDMIATHPEIAVAVLTRMARIIRAGDERITDLSLLSAEQRVCLELLRLAEPNTSVNEKLEIYPIPTQKLIASTVGVTRETVARIFGRLTDGGVVERKEKTLYIRDRDRLEEMALSNNGA